MDKLRLLLTYQLLVQTTLVITPTNLRGGTTITLNAEGETVTCLFKNAKWNVIAGNGYVVA